MPCAALFFDLWILIIIWTSSSPMSACTGGLSAFGCSVGACFIMSPSRFGTPRIYPQISASRSVVRHGSRYLRSIAWACGSTHRRWYRPYRFWNQFRHFRLWVLRRPQETHSWLPPWWPPMQFSVSSPVMTHLWWGTACWGCLGACWAYLAISAISSQSCWAGRLLIRTVRVRVRHGFQNLVRLGWTESL